MLSPFDSYFCFTLNGTVVKLILLPVSDKPQLNQTHFIGLFINPSCVESVPQEYWHPMEGRREAPWKGEGASHEGNEETFQIPGNR